MFFINVIGFVLILCCAGGEAVTDKSYVPFGYFAFEKSNPLYKPPKVRKPPYFPAEIPCPGYNDFYGLSPSDTLCGDLNLGFIPRNPMDQDFNNEPYPFELIKNKTLHFLANSLPVLKKEINNIPKVARFVGVKRKHNPQKGKLNKARPPQYQLRQKRSIDSNKTEEKPELRQKNCEGTNKLLCQLVQNYKEEGSISKSLLNTLSQTFGSAATISNIASLMNQYGGGVPAIIPNENVPPANKSTISQILSTLSGLSSSTNYNPIMSILDFVANYQNSPLNKSPMRRRNPEDDVAPTSSSSSSSTSSSPVTPCPSVDEYVTPVFARNYQGIWKYVVQIPNEGYFTQTIQKATCLKNKCDYLDGSCKESPRWVSLLVAEIFYPNIFFPMNQMKNDQDLYKLTSNLYPQYEPNQKIPSLEDFYNYQYLLQKRVGEVAQPQIRNDDSSIHPRRLKRNTNAKSSNLKTDKIKESSVNDINQQTENCDGYDKIGCYVIRVYYDWFLVNGSCKCWKSSSGSINEAIKRIFIGK